MIAQLSSHITGRCLHSCKQAKSGTDAQMCHRISVDPSSSRAAIHHPCAVAWVQKGHVTWRATQPATHTCVFRALVVGMDDTPVILHLGTWSICRGSACSGSQRQAVLVCCYMFADVVANYSATTLHRHALRHKPSQRGSPQMSLHAPFQCA